MSDALLSPELVEQLAAAVAQRLARQLGPAPLLTRRPWSVLGISRSAWFRAAAAGRTPKPVAAPGSSRPHYRVADLERWAERLRPARARRRAAAAETTHGDL
jgi:hypothetical protein